MALLSTENLTMQFGGIFAVKNLDFEVEEGEIVGLIGPNGAGKTTFFDLITGFLRPTTGNVFLEGKRIKGMSPHRITRLGIARTFQVVRPFGDLSVLDNVLVAALNREKGPKRARQHAADVLQFLEMAELKDVEAKTLTIGLRKRLELARAVATSPRLLLLDEVMNGLNATEIREMVGFIRRIHERGITVLIIEHIMSVIMNISHRIVVLNYGMKLAEGTPEHVAKDPEVLKAYLGEEESVVEG